MILLNDYKVLRKENEENRRMLKDIMAMLKERTPQVNVLLPLQALTKSGGATKRQKNSEEEQPLNFHPQVPENQEPYFCPQFREERHVVYIRKEGMIHSRREREQYQEVVDSTCKEVPRTPTKKAELDNQSMASARDMADIQKIVKGILK